jgi:hypothetical protein
VEVAWAGEAMAGGAVGKAGRKGKREDVAGRRVEALDTRPSWLWARFHCLLISFRIETNFMPVFLRTTLDMAPVCIPFSTPSVC